MNTARVSGNIFVPFLFSCVMCAYAASSMRINTAFSLLALFIGFCCANTLVPERQRDMHLGVGFTRFIRVILYPRGVHSDFRRCVAAVSFLSALGIVVPLVADLFSRLALIAFLVGGPASWAPLALTAVRNSHYTMFFLSPFYGDIVAALALCVCGLIALWQCAAFLYNVGSESATIAAQRRAVKKIGLPPREPTVGDLQRLFEELAATAEKKGDVQPQFKWNERFAQKKNGLESPSSFCWKQNGEKAMPEQQGGPCRFCPYKMCPMMQQQQREKEEQQQQREKEAQNCPYGGCRCCGNVCPIVQQQQRQKEEQQQQQQQQQRAEKEVEEAQDEQQQQQEDEVPAQQEAPWRQQEKRRAELWRAIFREIREENPENNGEEGGDQEAPTAECCCRCACTDQENEAAEDTEFLSAKPKDGNGEEWNQKEKQC